MIAAGSWPAAPALTVHCWIRSRSPHRFRRRAYSSPLVRRALTKKSRSTSCRPLSPATSSTPSLPSNPHRAPAAPPLHYLPPRFRALALFSRRPHQRVVRSDSPAAENLHMSGLMRCSKRRARLHNLVGAARASTDGLVDDLAPVSHARARNPRRLREIAYAKAHLRGAPRCCVNS